MIEPQVAFSVHTDRDRQQHLLTVHIRCCKSSKIPSKPPLSLSASLASPSPANDISRMPPFPAPSASDALPWPSSADAAFSFTSVLPVTRAPAHHPHLSAVGRVCSTPPRLPFAKKATRGTAPARSYGIYNSRPGSPSPNGDSRGTRADPQHPSLCPQNQLFTSRTKACS
jgi:hypothetical protein